MLIVGAKGFAKEVLDVLYQLNELDNLVFFDDLSENVPHRLYERFLVIKNMVEAEKYFLNIDKRYTIGIGTPLLRKKMADKMTGIGGELNSVISPIANIGHFDVEIGKGCNIMSNSLISNSVIIGEGCIVYFNTIVTHDSVLGNYVELSPGATVLGRAKIGNYTQIGSNATVLPDVIVGDNVVVGAGSVVTKDLPDNSVAVGVPATVIKKLNPLVFEQ